MKALAAAVFSAVCLVGCGTIPTPLPVAKLPEDYMNKDEPWAKINSLDDAAKTFLAYSIFYTDQAAAKRKMAQNANETSFYSSVIGVIGGIVKSATTAITGGVVGAGAGLFTDRYRLDVQAHNYETASTAMRCMYLATNDVNSGNVSAYRIQLLNGAPMPADAQLKRIAIDDLLVVLDHLYRLQASFQLGQPDVNKLKEPVIADLKTVKKPGEETGFVASGDEETQRQRIANYKGDMEKCTGLITG